MKKAIIVPLIVVALLTLTIPTIKPTKGAVPDHLELVGNARASFVKMISDTGILPCDNRTFDYSECYYETNPPYQFSYAGEMEFEGETVMGLAAGTGAEARLIAKWSFYMPWPGTALIEVDAYWDGGGSVTVDDTRVKLECGGNVVYEGQITFAGYGEWKHNTFSGIDLSSCSGKWITVVFEAHATTGSDGDIAVYYKHPRVKVESPLFESLAHSMRAYDDRVEHSISHRSVDYAKNGTNCYFRHCELRFFIYHTYTVNSLNIGGHSWSESDLGAPTTVSIGGRDYKKWVLSDGDYSGSPRGSCNVCATSPSRITRLQVYLKNREKEYYHWMRGEQLSFKIGGGLEGEYRYMVYDPQANVCLDSGWFRRSAGDYFYDWQISESALLGTYYLVAEYRDGEGFEAGFKRKAFYVERLDGQLSWTGDTDHISVSASFNNPVRGVGYVRGGIAIIDPRKEAEPIEITFKNPQKGTPWIKRLKIERWYFTSYQNALVRVEVTVSTEGASDAYEQINIGPTFYASRGCTGVRYAYIMPIQPGDEWTFIWTVNFEDSSCKFHNASNPNVEYRRHVEDLEGGAKTLAAIINHRFPACYTMCMWLNAYHRDKGWTQVDSKGGYMVFFNDIEGAPVSYLKFDVDGDHLDEDLYPSLKEAGNYQIAVFAFDDYAIARRLSDDIRVRELFVDMNSIIIRGNQTTCDVALRLIYKDGSPASGVKAKISIDSWVSDWALSNGSGWLRFENCPVTPNASLVVISILEEADDQSHSDPSSVPRWITNEEGAIKAKIITESTKVYASAVRLKDWILDPSSEATVLFENLSSNSKYLTISSLVARVCLGDEQNESATFHLRNNSTDLRLAVEVPEKVGNYTLRYSIEDKAGFTYMHGTLDLRVDRMHVEIISVSSTFVNCTDPVTVKVHVTWESNGAPIRHAWVHGLGVTNSTDNGVVLLKLKENVPGTYNVTIVGVEADDGTPEPIRASNVDWILITWTGLSVVDGRVVPDRAGDVIEGRVVWAHNGTGIPSVPVRVDPVGKEVLSGEDGKFRVRIPEGNEYLGGLVVHGVVAPHNIRKCCENFTLERRKLVLELVYLTCDGKGVKGLLRASFDDGRRASDVFLKLKMANEVHSNETDEFGYVEFHFANVPDNVSVLCEEAQCMRDDLVVDESGVRGKPVVEDRISIVLRFAVPAYARWRTGDVVSVPFFVRSLCEYLTFKDLRMRVRLLNSEGHTVREEFFDWPGNLPPTWAKSTTLAYKIPSDLSSGNYVMKGEVLCGDRVIATYEQTISVIRVYKLLVEVVDVEGRPVRGAIVRISEKAGPFFIEEGQGITSEGGKVAFALEEGTYRIEVFYQGRKVHDGQVDLHSDQTYRVKVGTVGSPWMIPFLAAVAVLTPIAVLAVKKRKKKKK